ncbi:MAG TPA: hypothetical protein VF696_02710 [Candidatus Paceibacterota bacterium]|jgi:uncharacterized membrane protein YbaN (DUF454 family)
MSKKKAVINDVTDSLKSGSPRRIGVTVFGILLFFVGAVGMFIPLFPGRTTMLLALILLSVQSPTVHAWVKRKTQKYPRIQSRSDRIRNWVINRVHK